MKTFIILYAIIALIPLAISWSFGTKVLKTESNLDASDGKYSHKYEINDGTYVSESGIGGQYAQGDARWYAPDGTPVNFQYIADENGYRVTGSHIPTPPPVPEYILRALEYIKTHQTKKEQNKTFPSKPSVRAVETKRSSVTDFKKPSLVVDRFVPPFL